MIFDEFAEIKEEVMIGLKTAEVSEETKAKLEALAEELTGNLKQNASSVYTLLSAELLTTMSSKGYAKTSHIGGEEFYADSVYLGKKGKLIAVFKPVGAAAYGTMEMPVDFAIAKLSDYDIALENSCANGYKSRMSHVENSARSEREIKQLAEKGSDYEEFGSW